MLDLLSFSFLSGYRTYALGVGGLLLAVGGFLTGGLSAAEALAAGTLALQQMAQRAALEKNTASK